MPIPPLATAQQNSAIVVLGIDRLAASAGQLRAYVETTVTLIANRLQNIGSVPD
jgi:hypothetical protein